ncbi:rRNA maturation RNase YbeY [Candidatus Aerophobetes bacterium]|uniref:Endoribonuclease YbeY n=1 Tax=Aerophobetes bacterium TaxID=2030807 RepID=A0A523UT42_UNCAE|nr:MAG: rRNA maturation RNase YbeY [Candidatus Aerophobetes bacterium]
MALIGIRNLQNKRIDTKWLKGAAASTLDLESVGRKKEVGIVLVDGEKMKDLNEKFRGRKMVTDVLAFPLRDNFVSTKDLLGEVIICVERAKQEAWERKHSLKEELTLLLVHGILHLLDYRDEKLGERKIMQEREKEILERLGMGRNVV